MIEAIFNGIGVLCVLTVAFIIMASLIHSILTYIGK